MCGVCGSQHGNWYIDLPFAPLYGPLCARCHHEFERRPERWSMEELPVAARYEDKHDVLLSLQTASGAQRRRCR